VDRVEHGGARVARVGEQVRQTMVTCTKDASWLVSGASGLVLLKTTHSEFHGYIKDRFTTLPETNDRVMATSLSARWRYRDLDVEWKQSFEEMVRVLTDTFADHHSLSLQQTLYAMGKAALEAHPEVAEVRLSMPNKHHFVVDLSPFGLDNPNEVFYASDRPYGLIEGTVTRDDAPEPGIAW
jgi:urate oxidase